MKLGGNVLRAGLAATLLVGGAALAERVADPFEHYDNHYALEGPSEHTEVFYMSVNYHDAQGEKHDDRVGDAILLAEIAAAGGYLALGLKGLSKRKADVTHT